MRGSSQEAIPGRSSGSRAAGQGGTGPERPDAAMAASAMSRRRFLGAMAAALGAAPWMSGAGLGRAPDLRRKAERVISTQGHTLYQLRPACLQQGGPRALVGAAYDGAVLALDQASGEPHWKVSTPGFPFDLAVADVDSDGADEVFVASADGTLYAIDHDGSPLWRFAQHAPLFQVAVTTDEEGNRVIATGGVGQVVHLLDAAGRELVSVERPACVRHLRSGRFGDPLRQGLVVATATSGLNGRLDIAMLRPADGTVLWSREGRGHAAPNSGQRWFSLVAVDVDADGRDEILVSHSWGDQGRVTAYDGAGVELWSVADRAQVPRIPYRMNLLQPAEARGRRVLLDLFANLLIEHRMDGGVEAVVSGTYAPAAITWDPVSSCCFLGGDVSGGDEILVLPTDRAGWSGGFGRHRSGGRLGEVEANLERLRAGVASYEAPEYQPQPRATLHLGNAASTVRGGNILAVRHLVLSQRTEAGNPLWCRRRDRRRAYDRTAAEIVAAAQECEARGEDFLLWAGHGPAPYMPLATMQAVLRAAPRHCRGFEFAELEQTDDHMAAIVSEILLPLAASCREHGRARIVVRNKNVFFNGSCYLPFWRPAWVDGTFADIFVAAMEETNCRTQELSLAGRIGLWLTGRIDHWACRVVTDNACFDRMWEWSSQQVLSHHLRHLVSRATLGAEVFFTDIHQGPFTTGLAGQLGLFGELLARGVVHVPARDQVLGLSPVRIAMREPSPRFLAHGTNGHSYTYREDDHAPLVFDRLDAYWAGAPLPPHDFSSCAFNVRRRLTAFLPEFPHGLVPIVPDATGAAPAHPGAASFATDGEWYYAADGRRQDPRTFAPVVEEALKRAARHMPLRVLGPAHWSASRLDPRHVRVLVMDPGYVDPAPRMARIVWPGLDVISCRDILTRELLKPRGGGVDVAVPAGVFRLLDITHREPRAGVDAPSVEVLDRAGP